MMEQDTDIEQLVLKESILSAAGIDASRLQVGLKGDPSLRETTFERKRNNSTVDSEFEQLLPCLMEKFAPSLTAPAHSSLTQKITNPLLKRIYLRN